MSDSVKVENTLRNSPNLQWHGTARFPCDNTAFLYFRIHCNTIQKFVTRTTVSVRLAESEARAGTGGKWEIEVNNKAVLSQGNRAMPQVFFSVEVRQH